MTFKFNFQFQNRGIKQKIAGMNKKGQFALDQQVIRDSNHYAPMDQGDLQESAIRLSNPGEGKIIWGTPYARRLYYNPQYNFSQDRNPNARGLWFEEAKSQHVKDWQKIIKAAMARGGF